MAIRIKLILSDETKIVLQSEEIQARIKVSADNYIRSQRASIRAEQHLIDSGLLEPSLWSYVQGSWLDRLEQEDAS